MTRAIDAAWIAAAQYERDRRAASYPRLIRDGKIARLWAHLDWQAWHCIAEWLQRGRCDMINAWGGDDEQDRILDWPLLEESAARALTSVETKLDRARANPESDPAALQLLEQRHAALAQVHRLVAQQRAIDDRTRQMVLDMFGSRQPAEAAA